MFFLSDLSSFSRPLGRKDKKPRIKRFFKSIFNKDTAERGAIGSGVGYALGRGSDIIRNGKFGHLKSGEALGLLGGLALGTGAGIRKHYKENK